MLAFLKKNKVKVKETAFSAFIRNASSKEKKRVYKEVLEKATARQLKVIEEAEKIKRCKK